MYAKSIKLTSWELAALERVWERDHRIEVLRLRCRSQASHYRALAGKCTAEWRLIDSTYDPQIATARAKQAAQLQTFERCKGVALFALAVLLAAGVYLAAV